MLAHAPNIGSWRVEIQGHVTAGGGGQARGGGVSGGTCRMAINGSGIVAFCVPRHLP